MCIYVYIVRICLKYKYICIYIYVCMYACMHACMDGWTDVCMYVICIWLYWYMYKKSVYINEYIYIYTHARQCLSSYAIEKHSWTLRLLSPACWLSLKRMWMPCKSIWLISLSSTILRWLITDDFSTAWWNWQRKMKANAFSFVALIDFATSAASSTSRPPDWKMPFNSNTAKFSLEQQHINTGQIIATYLGSRHCYAKSSGPRGSAWSSSGWNPLHTLIATWNGKTDV